VCRISHIENDISVILHWWPTHGRVLEIRGSLSPEEINANIDVAKEALDFFRTETRGDPKITNAQVAKTIKKLGTDATLTSVAKEMSVTRQALQFWARRGGMKSWEQVKERYGATEVW
jgi:hypothetical protein